VDEMPAPSPVQALAKIREELTGWVASARVVLTCRVNVWDANHNALQGFDTYRTLEFSYGDGNKPDQVKEFICQWFSNTDKPELGEALREKLDKERHQRIRDLVKNPLRLSLLCQSWYFHQGDLPKTKAALYEQFTQAFYEWKKEPHSTTLTQRKELNTALGLLAREAIDKEKSRFGIRRHFALDIMGEYLFNLATEKLNWLVHVYNDADTGQPVYAFFHPTFQEYFAACAIDDWDYFLNHIPDNPAQGTYRIFERQWKEVILLWLGRDDVPKHKKEDFIATLVNFEDDCWDFYWYRAFFLAAAGIDELKDCIDADWADWIVAKLVEYATEEPYTGVDRVVNPAIWATLLETNRARAINVLIEVLESSFLDEEVRWKVFNSLIQIGTANSKVIAALNKLMDTSLDDKELPLEAAFFLGKINPEKREAVKFLEQQLWNTFLPDWVRHKAAYFLGKIDQGNGEAINFLTELIERNKSLDLGAASTLGKIDPGNHTAIETLTELLKTERGDRFLNIPLIAARNLLEIDPENPEAIRVLREFIKPGHKRWERLEAASALGKTKQGKKEAIKVLCELMHEAVEIAQDIRLSKAVISSLYQIDRRILEPSPGWVQRTFSGEDDLEYVAAQIAFSKYCLSQEINIDVENSNYEIMWFLAQITAYPIFYQAWHGEPSLAQTLEKQVSDIPSQVQPTDKTYPIAIDAQTLKLETNTSAIAQKLCTKIYHKAGYSDIPTVSDAAQLQQYIPRIQEKLQKPNLALILHGCEPNEHLINFCYSLADPDIGFHIGLITSKPIEQPLKGFLPNQDNLLSAIQTWINEIG
jgi:HEAT repeat protein